MGRASTIGREPGRGRTKEKVVQPCCARGGDGCLAQRKRCGRRRTLACGIRLYDRVRGKRIHRRWFPAQIACKFEWARHETIYAAICMQPGGGLKALMITALRQHEPARKLRRTILPGGPLPWNRKG